MTLEMGLNIVLGIVGVLLMRVLSNFDAQVERAVQSLEALNVKMAVICERVDSHEKRVDFHEKRITDLEKT